MQIAQNKDDGAMTSASGNQNHVGVFRIADIGAFEEVSRPWEIMVTQADAKRFDHQKTFLVTPNVILYKESFESAVRVRGLTPSGMLSLTVPLRLGDRSAYWNAPLQEKGLPASMPGGLDALVDSGQVHLIILINLALLRSHMAEESYNLIVNLAGQHVLPVAGPDIHALGQWLMSVLQAAVKSPVMFEQGGAVRTLEEDLVQRLSDIAESAGLSTVQPPVIHKRRQGLDRIYEYLRNVDPASLSIFQLCEVAGVSRRTLEYAFRDEFDITPMGFIKMMRLHAARRALLTTHSRESNVADVAHRLGIYEQGRFALDYRRLFGELPSKTMLKPVINDSSPLEL